MTWTIEIPDAIWEQAKNSMFSVMDVNALILIKNEVEAANSLNDMLHLGETRRGDPAFYAYNRIFRCRIEEAVSPPRIVILSMSM